MKSAIIGGPDEELVIAGSDDFKAYVWTIPADLHSSEDGNAQGRRLSSRAAIDVSRAIIESPSPSSPANERQGDMVAIRKETWPVHILSGHRSIVNNAAYHSDLQLIFTSGIEKMVKIHSPSPLFDCHEGSDSPQSQRTRFSRLDLNALTVQALAGESADSDDGNVDEDPRTLALFDFLVCPRFRFLASTD